MMKVHFTSFVLFQRSPRIITYLNLGFLSCVYVYVVIFMHISKSTSTYFRMPVINIYVWTYSIHSSLFDCLPFPYFVYVIQQSYSTYSKRGPMTQIKISKLNSIIFTGNSLYIKFPVQVLSKSDIFEGYGQKRIKLN